MGGEGAHGMLVLSPRAVQRLEIYTPAWPLPKIFRLTSGGKLSEAIFKGDTINTPSLLCIEDAIDGLRWGESIGGLKGIDGALQRQSRCAGKVRRRAAMDFIPRCRQGDPLQYLGLPHHPGAMVTNLPADRQAAAAKKMADLLETEKAGYDVASYRDAPPGLAHLVWRHRRAERSFGPAAVARLGLWRDRAGIRREGGRLSARLTLRSGPTGPRLEGWATKRASVAHPSRRRFAPPQGEVGVRRSFDGKTQGAHSDELSPRAVEIFPSAAATSISSPA